MLKLRMLVLRGNRSPEVGVRVQVVRGVVYQGEAFAVEVLGLPFLVVGGTGIVVSAEIRNVTHLLKVSHIETVGSGIESIIVPRHNLILEHFNLIRRAFLLLFTITGLQPLTIIRIIPLRPRVSLLPAPSPINAFRHLGPATPPRQTSITIF